MTNFFKTICLKAKRLFTSSTSKSPQTAQASLSPQSRTLNSKFKIGDRVKVIHKISSFYSYKGTVVEISADIHAGCYNLVQVDLFPLINVGFKDYMLVKLRKVKKQKWPSPTHE